MKDLEISGAFDIECSDWDVFQVAATYSGGKAKLFYNGDALIDYLIKRGGTWWAHAGGIYDMLYVLERARERGIPCQVDRSQHRVTRIVMGSLTMRDSYALWPAPLDELCGAIGAEVPALPWACTCGRDCGGYCRISEKASEGDPDLESYVKADAKSLYDALHKLREFAIANRITLKGTLGQTAWIAAQTELGIPDSDIPWHIWRHAKLGDKGGRIAVIRPFSHGPGSHHDICNAYPAQLSKIELPIGHCRELGTNQASLALERCRPGIYTLTVNVPGMFLPPLPWRYGGQIIYPTGEFRGSWSLPELVAAFERGTKVVKVHKAIIWESTAQIFGALIDRWYEIRRNVGRKTPFGQWVGRMAKALTGKLAEKPDKSRVTMHPDTIKICARQYQCKNGCNGRCGAYEQLDLYGKIWSIPYQKIAPSAYPHWSAYLRAATRIQWLSQAERFGEDLCMGNTDSLWTTGRCKPEPLGDGLGQWEYQHAWTDLEVRSPTIYAYRDELGDLQMRGIPGITAEDWRHGGGRIDRGVTTLGQAVSGTHGLFYKRSRRWSLPKKERYWYGDRYVGYKGITYPADAEVFREIRRRKLAA